MMSSIDEISLYKTVIPNLIINRTILSPIRSEKTPSFCVYKSKRDGRYWWYDFGIGRGGDVLSLVAICNNTNRDEIKRKFIVRDSILKHDDYKIEFKIIESNNILEHLKYFEKYHITKDILDKYDIICTDKILKRSSKDRDFEEYIYSTVDYPIFAYLYSKSDYNCFCIVNNIKNDNELFYKIYTPGRIKRFEANIRGLWADGFKQLQYKSNTLIITKSRKDVMCLDLLGFESISFNSESVNIGYEFVDILKGKYKHIYLLYDNDKAGYIGSKKICGEYGFNPIFIPIDTKDVSDTMQKYGIIETKKTINQLINDKHKKIN